MRLLCLTLLLLALSAAPVSAEPCDYDPCMNGATCLNDGDIFICVCSQGWLGEFCDLEECEISEYFNETISSPNFPFDYVNGFFDTWTITAPPGKMIMVEFSAFALESCGYPIYSYCGYDWVMLSDATDTSGRLCGRGCPQRYIFRSNSVTLEFHTDSSIYCNGFSAHFYYIHPVSVCFDNPCVNGGTCHEDGDSYFCQCTEGWIGVHCELQSCYTSANPQETLIYPDFLNGYENNEDITWTITAPNDKHIRVEFAFFSLENCYYDLSTGCSFDWLMVFNEHFNSERFCGQGCPGEYIVHSNIVNIDFHSDGSLICEGFVVYFYFIDPVLPCYDNPCLHGGSCNDHEGYHSCHCDDSWLGINCEKPACPTSDNPQEIITYPDLLHGVYGNSFDYTWTVTAPPHKFIRVEFAFFALESCSSDIYTGCHFDWVTLFDAYSNHGRYCGHGCPGSLMFYSNFVTLHFHTDSSVICDGFQAHFYFVDPVPTDYTCHITGDPHVLNYESTFHVSLPFSCLYLATRATFVVSGGATVDVQVITSNGLTTASGRYYVDYVMIVIEDTAGTFRVTYESDISMVTSAMMIVGQSAWTFDDTALPSYVHVLMHFDRTEGAAYLLVGENGQGAFIIQVKFFPRLQLRNYRRERGMEMTVSGFADYVYPFPETVCDMLSGGPGTSAIPGPFSDDTKVLMAVLQQQLPQSNPMCQDVVDTYGDCDTTREVAVAQCQQYLQRHKSRCLYDSSEEGQARQNFLSCLRHMCGIQDNYNCDGDHCEMGGNCEDSNCEALADLECLSDVDCYHGAICDSNICKIEANEGENCHFCHRVCGGDDTVCDANFICNPPVPQSAPGDPCNNNAQCTNNLLNLVCSQNTCRVLLGESGCEVNDHCVGNYECENGHCIFDMLPTPPPTPPFMK